MQRLLEHCLLESNCIDVESLCITSGLRAWMIRVDVHVLNYAGNVTDAASIAAIAALIHFRRPDVSVCGEDFVIHSLTERYPKMFFCIKFNILLYSTTISLLFIYY